MRGEEGYIRSEYLSQAERALVVVVYEGLRVLAQKWKDFGVDYEDLYLLTKYVPENDIWVELTVRDDALVMILVDSTDEVVMRCVVDDGKVKDVKVDLEAIKAVVHMSVLPVMKREKCRVITGWYRWGKAIRRRYELLRGTIR